MQVVREAQAKAKEVNPGVKFSAESSNCDVNNQTNQFDSFIAFGTNVILLNAGVAPAVMRAKAEWMRRLNNKQVGGGVSREILRDPSESRELGFAQAGGTIRIAQMGAETSNQVAERRRGLETGCVLKRTAAFAVCLDE